MRQSLGMRRSQGLRRAHRRRRSHWPGALGADLRTCFRAILLPDWGPPRSTSNRHRAEMARRASQRPEIGGLQGRGVGGRHQLGTFHPCCGAERAGPPDTRLLSCTLLPPPLALPDSRPLANHLRHGPQQAVSMFDHALFSDFPEPGELWNGLQFWVCLLVALQTMSTTAVVHGRHEVGSAGFAPAKGDQSRELGHRCFSSPMSAAEPNFEVAVRSAGSRRDFKSALRPKSGPNKEDCLNPALGACVRENLQVIEPRAGHRRPPESTSCRKSLELALGRHPALLSGRRDCLGVPWRASSGRAMPTMRAPSSYVLAPSAPAQLDCLDHQFSRDLQAAHAPNLCLAKDCPPSESASII